MSGHFVIIDFDTERMPFQAVLSRQVFKVSPLERLHRAWRYQTGRRRLTYADNLKLRRVMQRVPDESPFYRLYHRWVARVLAPHYGGKISYSAHPKMRVHLAGTGCVSEFHCDADVTGREDQINCYLPFTDVFDTCTIWSELDYGSGEYHPLNLKYGQALIWDGGRLRHGTVFNESNTTRVSCDFRFHAKEPHRVSSPWCDILAGRPSAN